MIPLASSTGQIQNGAAESEGESARNKNNNSRVIGQV
jgi:hypothetical protein